MIKSSFICKQSAIQREKSKEKMERGGEGEKHDEDLDNALGGAIQSACKFSYAELNDTTEIFSENRMIGA
ncbi:hypothetical protein SUGI_0766170 [Cryptomeria japonica]|nr:hypothetical protein SUGI_0766170 [Cryptomeria japonica]